ncbi:helix-turn-helix transcriptional regulator [Gloeocapsopsis crepidinum LEGE 06123]|uniref:Helix-turn-helix transcriptional regulator n=2 Tax=Gloeocapsopsis crepidinum TaxID=693223 RepID=A0ABR9UTE4_9CHRO|nr:TetR/AcrR family transcriptional regulator [Gloeocapsopsis crepidinum]MBE9191546.1 helix-turn-helix transcriptional regulator [Gloeocapsopsis crepidinum LEGE 06123]
MPVTIRDRILDAARHLAKDYPIDKITMSAIAQKAGVSQPTVRRYLGSKDQLQAFLANEQQRSPQSAPLDTRSRILQAAQQVFAQEGYERATLDAIANAIGLTKGAVYWHFQSKSDLFLALLEEQLQSPLSITPEVAQQTLNHPNPQAEVAKVLARQLHHITANPNWCRLYMEFMVQSREPEVQNVLISPNCRERETAIVQMLHRLQAEGKLAADVDPFVIGVFWAALIDGLMLAQMVEPERINLVAWSDQLARLLWQGIQPTSNS